MLGTRDTPSGKRCQNRGWHVQAPTSRRQPPLQQNGVQPTVELLPQDGSPRLTMLHGVDNAQGDTNPFGSQVDPASDVPSLACTALEVCRTPIVTASGSDGACI